MQSPDMVQHIKASCLESTKAMQEFLLADGAVLLLCRHLCMGLQPRMRSCIHL